MSTIVVVEFTIEPFVEGEPGKHVNAAIEAVRSMGIAVDVGPFGSSFAASSDTVADAVKALLTAAYSNGATHVNIHAENQA
jgi:uncharacterized protein YqgV (UPF0045/DUF77 family)